MVSRIFWQAEDKVRAAGWVVRHRVMGGLYSLTMISKLRSRPESESAELEYPQGLRVRRTEIVRSTADCEDGHCQHYVIRNRV